MIAGVVLMVHAWRGTTHERVVTRVLGRSDTRRLPSAVTDHRTVRETIQDRDHP